MFELRRKGYSWREIADFLVEKGVKTDHSRVYRVMIEGDPLYDFRDCPLIIGGLPYESQKGLPLRPYDAGLLISIKSKLKAMLLEHSETINSVWCHCQFRLSDVPNRVWLKQLHAKLFAEFNPDFPHHLVSIKGFELKFQGDVMALDCRRGDLHSQFKTVLDGITKTTEIFLNDKTRLAALWQKIEDRNRKILDIYESPGETVDEILEGHSEWFSEQENKFKEDFDALPLF